MVFSLHHALSMDPKFVFVNSPTSCCFSFSTLHFFASTLLRSSSTLFLRIRACSSSSNCSISAISLASSSRPTNDFSDLGSSLKAEKIQTSQNKCIRYCLNLDNRAHVGIDEFIKINWLPTKERVAQCICVNIFKFFNKMSPQYMSEIFHPSHSRYNTRMANT